MSRETEQLLALVRDAEDPTPADEERVLRALQAAVAAGVPADYPAPRALPARFGVSALKLAAITAGLAGAIASVVLLRASEAPRTDERPAATLPARSVEEPPRPAEPPKPATEPPRTPTVPPKPAATEPAGQRIDAKGGARNAATARASRPPGAALRPEIELLERVQAALKHGDGAAALRALDSHATADRVLLAERQAARILALCLVGRVAEARQAAAAFARQHPDSPQREAIAGSCANSRRIEQP
jgi:hypothetical protein